MIPCLYDVSETEYKTNGIGKLPDCISCHVAEKRNGSYELEMEYPADGIHAEDLSEENIILARPADGKAPQPFRIYDVTSSLSGTLKVEARHISYQLNAMTVSPTTVVSGTHDQVNEAFKALKKNATTDCPFDFETDIESDAYFGILEPVSFRCALGGVDGSVLDTYGGEYEWDFYTVRLWKARGADNGVRIAYGKNLVDFTQEKNDEEMITGVHPFWKDNDTGDITELTEKVVVLEDSGLPYERIGLLDCTSEFEDEPTQAQLREYARSYLASTSLVDPSIDIDIDFEQLWQTEDYADIAEAERVGLCDTVHVYVSALGIEIDAKVTETDYDVLLERYKSITLSNSPTSSRNSSISLTVATTENVHSMIAMTDSEIRMSVSKTYATKATLENDYSTTVETQALIDLSAEAVTLEFDKKLRDDYSTTEEIRSMIELSEEGIKLEFTKYSTTEEVQSMIKVSEDGIAMTYVKNGNVRSQFAMEDDSITISTGRLTFNSGTIAITSGNFTLTSSGSATFSGTLSAPSGNIGGFTIGSSSLYDGKSSVTSSSSGVYVGTNGISVGGSTLTARLQSGRLYFTYSGSDTSYLSGNTYYTGTGIYGLRVAGQGCVAVLTPYFGVGSYVAAGSDATFYIGQTGSQQFITDITVNSSGLVTGYSYRTLTFRHGLMCTEL